MKITKLTIKNIGILEDVVININKPLLLFYGDISQGKSSILKSFLWLCGGAFPSDIIRRGQKEASIIAEFDGGMIARSFYVNAKGETAARPITFVRDGKPVASPVNEIKRLMNPFLLDQDHLIKMNELERKRFFAELFAVDTVDLDKQIWNKANEASSLRAKISGYGIIDVAPVLKVDVGQLEDQLKFERKNNEEAEQKYRNAESEVKEHNATVQRGVETKASLESQIKELQSKLSTIESWLAKNPVKKMPTAPALVDTTSLESKLREAGAQNVRHEQYLANMKRNEEKQAEEKKLVNLEADQRKLKADKLAKLKEVNTNCKVDGLKFDDDGNFSYNGCAAGMLSTSELMTLSSKLSALYPEGLGVELLDRGESLGKSIFTFVKRAEEEKISILATIVGERPANVPENIGVFVVEKGRLS
jgi:DNA repair exonuclease SbcCD ATPase subunit